MAEWTPDKRNEFYRLLASCQFSEIRTLIKPFEELKVSDYEPKDKAAVKTFIQQATGNIEIQKQILEMLFMIEKPIVITAFFCFKILGEVPSAALSEEFRKNFYPSDEPVNKADKPPIKRELQTFLEKLWGKLKNESQWYTEQYLFEMPRPWKNSLEYCLRTICLQPTQELVDAIFKAPKAVRKYYPSELRVRLEGIAKSLTQPKAQPAATASTSPTNATSPGGAAASARETKSIERPGKSIECASGKTSEKKKATSASVEKVSIAAPSSSTPVSPPPKEQFRSLMDLLNEESQKKYEERRPLLDDAENAQLDGCKDYDQYRDRIASVLNKRKYKSQYASLPKAGTIDFNDICETFRMILDHRKSFEWLEKECWKRFRPEIQKEFESVEKTQPISREILDRRFVPAYVVYLICSPNPEPELDAAFKRVVLDHWSERYESGEALLSRLDQCLLSRNWWVEPVKDCLIQAITSYRQFKKVPGAEHPHGIAFGWRTLHCLNRDFGDDALNQVMTEVDKVRSMAGKKKTFFEVLSWLSISGSADCRNLIPLMYCLWKGAEGYRLFLHEPRFPYHRELLHEFGENNPDLVRDHLAAWDPIEYPPSIIQMRTLPDYLDVPAFSELIAGRLAVCLESGSPQEIDWAWPIVIENPARLAPSGHSLLELVSRGLWLPKPPAASKAIGRLADLADSGICTHQEAAAAIQDAFQTEVPMLWGAAAKVLSSWKKAGKTIEIKNPKRIQEIISRDPAKYEKIFRSL